MINKIKSGEADEWWFLPEIFWPRAEMKQNRRQLPTQQLWTEFLQATLFNFVDFGKYWYPRALAAYAASLLFMHILLVVCRRRGLWKGFTLFRVAARLVFWHALVASLGWIYYTVHVGQGTWARNIKKEMHDIFRPFVEQKSIQDSHFTILIGSLAQ